MLLEAPRRVAAFHSAEHQTSLFCLSNFGLKSWSPALIWPEVMSECMSVTKRSISPSRSRSKNFRPIEPHGVRGNTDAVLSTKRWPRSLE